jgi:acetyl esterase/lipase
MSEVHTGIEYGERLALDLHLAADREAPVVLYVHGGGFARGSRSDDAERIASLVSAGVTIASIDYRLSPAVRYPEPIADVVAAARFLRTASADFGVRTERIGAIGASAGGYLVTMAALMAPGALDAVSPWFAPFDLWTSSRRSPLEQRMAPVTFEANLLETLDDASLREASPISHDLGAAPPFLLVHGDRDRIVASAQSQAMHAVLQRAGRSSTLMLVGGAGHEDPRFDAGSVPAAVAGWLRGVLDPAFSPPSGS